MNIKDKQALLQLKQTIDHVDQLINSDTYDDIREDNSELFGLLQTLQSDLNNSVDFSENTKLNDLINLANDVYDNPSDMALVSQFIENVKNSGFKVDEDDLDRLKFFKNNDDRVLKYTTSIRAQLQSQ